MRSRCPQKGKLIRKLYKRVSKPGDNIQNRCAAVRNREDMPRGDVCQATGAYLECTERIGHLAWYLSGRRKPHVYVSILTQDACEGLRAENIYPRARPFKKVRSLTATPDLFLLRQRSVARKEHGLRIGAQNRVPASGTSEVDLNGLSY